MTTGGRPTIEMLWVSVFLGRSQLFSAYSCGMGRRTLAKILGHTSVKTTLDEYGTKGIEDVQSNYEKVVGEMF